MQRPSIDELLEDCLSWRSYPWFLLLGSLGVGLPVTLYGLYWVFGGRGHHRAEDFGGIALGLAFSAAGDWLLQNQRNNIEAIRAVLERAWCGCTCRRASPRT